MPEKYLEQKMKQIEWILWLNLKLYVPQDMYLEFIDCIENIYDTWYENWQSDIE